MNISEIKYTHTAFAVCCVANCCAGMLIIWQFQSELFFTLDITRFILWAHAFSLPWLLCHYIACAVILDFKSTGEESHKLFLLASTFTSIGITVVTMICRLLNWSLMDFVWLAAGWHLLVCFAGWLAERDSRREEKANALLSSETPVSAPPAPETRVSDTPRASTP